VHRSIFRISVPFGSEGVVQLYLVRGAKAALVDTGVSTAPLAYLAPALRGAGLDLADVDLVVNTHGHFDHTGGNAIVKKASGAKIEIHANDAIYCVSAEHHASVFRRPFDMLGLAGTVEEQAAWILEQAGDSAGVDRKLVDGDALDLGRGVRFQVLHTPGHTAGSICLYWEDEGVLLSGDAVQGRGSRAGGLPIYESPYAYRESLERLMHLPTRLLLLGHRFNCRGAVSSPQRQGDDVMMILRESHEVSITIEKAVRTAAVAQPGGADLLKVARATVGELTYEFPMELDHATGLPRHGVGTLLAHLVGRTA
jgi:glyoxylase-like metal-dependent hydrolase (beta-lactamase superfamily II)